VPESRPAQNRPNREREGHGFSRAAKPEIRPRPRREPTIRTCRADTTCPQPLTPVTPRGLAHLYAFCKGGDDEAGDTISLSIRPPVFLSLRNLLISTLPSENTASILNRPPVARNHGLQGADVHELNASEVPFSVDYGRDDYLRGLHAIDDR
jgi:hypothetical protein